MIDSARIDTDEGGNLLVVHGDFLADGVLHAYIPDSVLAELDLSLQRWREHQAVGEQIRQERVAAGSPSWDEYAAEMSDDPGEALRAHSDFLRKQRKERAA